MWFYLLRIVPLLLICLFGPQSNIQDDTIELDLVRAQKMVNGPDGLYYLLSQREVVAELELTRHQIKKLRKVVDAIESKTRDLRLEERELINQGKREESQKIYRHIRQIKTEELKAFEGLLLPHQQKRLNQIAFQDTFGRNNQTNLYLSPKIVDGLKMTEQQKTKLTELYKKRNQKILEAYQKFEKQFVGIQHQSHQDLLKLLDAQQRASADEHIGPTSNYYLSASKIGFVVEQQPRQKNID